MTLWRSTLFLAVLGIFTIAFLTGLSLLGLKTDRTGGELPDAEVPEMVPEAEGEGDDGAAFHISLDGRPGLPL